MLAFSLLFLTVFGTEYCQASIFSIQDKKLGQIQIETKFVEEPVSEPLRIIVSLKCKGLTQFREIKKIRTCEFTSHSFNKEDKVVTIRHKRAVIQKNGILSCKHEDSEDIELYNACEEKNN